MYEVLVWKAEAVFSGEVRYIAWGPRTRIATIADSSSFHPPLGGFRGCLGKLGDSEAIFDIATVPPNTPMEANIA